MFTLVVVIVTAMLLVPVVAIIVARIVAFVAEHPLSGTVAITLVAIVIAIATSS